MDIAPDLTRVPFTGGSPTCERAARGLGAIVCAIVEIVGFSVASSPPTSISPELRIQAQGAPPPRGRATDHSRTSSPPVTRPVEAHGIPRANVLTGYS
ncbi:hypothetical protein DDE18_19425 [Nocardioides gansuensis]|uniref:Uncharacterized protein n=1 Tax=Nocardioides gansuensis TaxID=2138300 RepID=A0A2T8F5L4_9ACTN|nr:hypothetical protein DDE18_19425 [Nocardioides gansuensis]